MEYTYHLAKYAGPASRLVCPQCGRKQSFVPYVNDVGEILAPNVGRCNHESSCSYHYTPKNYFQDHPEQCRRDTWRQTPDWLKHRPASPQPAAPVRHMRQDYLPSGLLDRTAVRNHPCNFITFLSTLFGSNTIRHLVAEYHIGVTKDGSAIFYQIDQNGHTRGGKIIQYNPATGRRIKNAALPVDWVHTRLKKAGVLSADWTLSQCLFGEHLLPKYPEKLVFLVEAEKTAIIGAGFLPQYIWIATGGKTQLGDKLSVLAGRKVLAIPDIDAYPEWKRKLESRSDVRISVSDLLLRLQTQEGLSAQADVADWLIHWKQQPVNPVLNEVAKYFSKEYLPEVEAVIRELDLEITAIINPQDNENPS